jgi:membrane protein implicated in regulation of membrane protease activity
VDAIMEEWMNWLVLAGILAILEIFSGTFYLLMIAVGALAGAMLAWFGFGNTAQILIAAVVALIATYILRNSKYGKIQKRGEAARDPNVNLDIGQILKIDDWKQEAGDQYIARVTYRGALWDVELERHSDPAPGLFKICEIRGSRLIVANKALHAN